MKNREEILAQAKKAGACVNEYQEAYKAYKNNDYDEFDMVVMNYFYWVSQNIDIELLIDYKDNITNSYNAYIYCRYINDIEDIRNKITDSEDAYLYCRDVSDIEEVRDRITNSYHIMLYNQYKKNKVQ
jgi:uncharacterized protein Yka (UPF0111/DUF47 family)